MRYHGNEIVRTNAADGQRENIMPSPTLSGGPGTGIKLVWTVANEYPVFVYVTCDV